MSKYLVAISFLLGFAYNYYLPKIEKYILEKVETVANQRAPVHLKIERLQLHLLPLGVELQDVKIEPTSELGRYLAPTTVKSVGARLAIFPLIRGDIRLSRLSISQSDINLFLRSDLFKGAQKKNTPLKIDLSDLYRIPIDEVLIEGVRVQAKLEPQNVVFRSNDLHVLIENRFRSILLETNTPEVLIKPSGPFPPLVSKFDVRMLLSDSGLQVSAFKLRANESFIVASGQLSGDLLNGKIEGGDFDTRLKMRLADLNIWERVFFTKSHLPELKGHLETDIGLDVDAQSKLKVSGDLRAEGFQFSKFYIGDINAKILSDLKTLTLQPLIVSNNSGSVEVQHLDLTLDKSAHFKADVEAKSVDIRNLLNHLSIKNVPLLLSVSGNGSCKGTLLDPLQVDCDVKGSVPRLHVYTDKVPAKTIVDILNIRAKGHTQLTLHDFSFQSQLMVGKESHGSGQGIVSYEHGFKISYQGDRVDLKDIKNLANLKMEGQGQVTGTTTGTSKWATIDLDFKGENYWLADYPLGNLTGHMNYKAGHLIFSKTDGQLGVSRYSGQAEIDLLSDQIRLGAQIPFVELRDVQSIFQRKYQLPFHTSGTGTAKISASGPFDFPHMSYNLKSTFFRGEIANESFDEITFNVKSINGMVQSQQIQAKKASGQVTLKGGITPEGDIDAVVLARGLRLEQSENISNLGLDLQGLADLTLLIKGRLPKPNIELNGRMSRVILADEPAQDSVFKLNFLSDRINGSGQLFGSTVLADFTWPYEDSGPFGLKLKTKQWDFTNIFSLISRSARQLDFETSLSMDVNLQSTQGGFWGSSGEALISNFLIRKGTKEMKATKPMTATMRNGTINSSNLGIFSGESYLKLALVDLTKDNLNASLNGKMDLSLLGLFTPFISDLRGLFSVAMDLKGSVDRPKISGSAYIEKGFAKFADFPHPFANTQADLLFNDDQILINSVRSDLGGGQVEGGGRLTFRDGKHQVETQGTFKGVQINLPTGFVSNGSGTVAITGDNFPYKMAIDYSVAGGNVTYEFGEDTANGTDLRASSYLPKFSEADIFHPFIFDVNVKIKEPVNVSNSLVQAQVSGQVRATGTPDRLSLDGTINPMPGGKVFFHEVPFEVTSSYVEYAQMPPENPRIFLTANSRVTESVQSDQGRTVENQYDVNLLVQGRAQNPQITLTSQPPLSQREIISLLALGVTGGSLDQTSQNYRATNTSTVIGAAILQRAGRKRLKDTLGVDVKVTSSQPTPEDPSTPRVTLSKQLTPNLNASASSTIKANASNDVKVEYKMNDNISVVGSWEGRETNPKERSSNDSIFGLDLEYKVQFK